MGERLFKLLGALVLASSFAVGWLWMDYQAFAEQPLELPEEGMRIVVPPGSGLKGVANGLQRQGVLSRPRYLVWMARLGGLEHAIKAGEYDVAAGTTPKELLRQLAEGRVVQYAFTVVEGWTFREMLQALHAHPDLQHTLQGVAEEEMMSRLGAAPGEHPEGRFLPETYHFPKGTTDLDFLKRAYRAMSERLEAEWANRAEGLPLRTPYEALILASIVEKETGLAEERPSIAGVFVRRLQKGMRLQTDPTVIYGLGEQFDGNIRRRDLKIDSPYNTYRRKGLPPTPIALPGPDAIHAALHPEEGEALYFVARGDGSHHFSASLTEHNDAVIKYQLKGNPRAFSSHPAPR